MVILLIIATLFTLGGAVLFLNWAMKANLITVKWDIISEKLHENLVFALLFTALFSWFELILTLLLLNLK